MGTKGFWVIIKFLILSIVISLICVFMQGIPANAEGDSDVAPMAVSRPESDVITEIKATVNVCTLGANDLSGIFYEKTGVNTALKWYDTRSLGIEPWNGEIISDVLNLRKDSEGNYLVGNGAELVGALKNCPANSSTIIKLDKDIDLNGAEQDWVSVAFNKGQTLDGNGHTIYNLCVRASKTATASRVGFFTSLDQNAKITNLNFVNSLMIGVSKDPGSAAGTGVVGYLAGGTVSDIHMKDCIFIGYGNMGTICGRAVGNSNDDVITLTNISAQDCNVYGLNHIGSLTGPLVLRSGLTADKVKISKGWSTGCSVYSTGAHSGGLISCLGGGTVENCFTDVNLYGSSKTGVFTGAMNNNTIINNCAASGFIEGNNEIGGFIGSLGENKLSSSGSISNCYTTALVGLNAGGIAMGGFTGCIVGGTGNTVEINNCYAAGEVGYIDVDTEAKENGKNGGFIGSADTSTNNKTQFKNCFYDKQTTAMKERVVGSDNTKYADGIKGVLTTDTNKSGTGLTGNPGTLGFTGFEGSAFNTANLEHLPELNIFKNATDWDGYENVVKNYSLSSTSTVFLDTWDNGLNTQTGKLDKPITDTTVYCTVRDLTSGFNMTSTDSEFWYRVKNADSNEDEDTKVTVNGKIYDVLSLKHQNDVFLCDELMPGMQWLRVTSGSDDSATARRLRVIPTASIDAGKSTFVIDTYDHADDVKTFYSTPIRLKEDMSDVSSGIFPDSSAPANSNDLTDEQIALMSNIKNQQAYSTASAINELFKNSNDKFANIDMNYISKGGDNAKESKLFVYVYKVNSIDDNGELQCDTTPLNISDGSSLASMFNGYSKFTNENTRYLVTYMWELNDGRVIQDAKLVRRAEVPFTLNLNVYKNTDGVLYSNGSYVYAGNVNTTSLSQSIVSGANTTSKFQYKENSQAAWKLKNTKDTIKSLKITTILSDNESYSKTIDNPTAGDIITIEETYYRIVYKNHSYFSIPEKVQRSYKLNYDENSRIWYLTFDKKNESTDIDDIVLNDMERNMRVDVVVQQSKTTHLTVDKKWEGDNAENRPAFVSVQLLCDGEKYGDAVKLNHENNWTFTWEDLSRQHTWSVDEVNVPKGYTKIVTGSDEEYTITNKKSEPNPLKTTHLTVDKKWEGDNAENRPAFVSVQLLCDGEKYGDAVKLNHENNWTFTWEDLSRQHTWSVDEVNVPEGYTKIVTGSDEEYTITNKKGEPNPPLGQSDIQIFKAPNKVQINKGGYLTYNITVKNNGNKAANGVVLQDYVPQNTTFYKINDKLGTYGAKDGKEYITWFIKTLKQGESKILSFTVKVNECIDKDASINNFALFETTDSMDEPINIDLQNSKNTSNRTQVKIITSGVNADTGDNNNLVLYIIMLITSGILASIIIIMRKKQYKKMVA